MESTMRQCVACGEVKPLNSDFFPGRLTKTGERVYYQKCRACYGWGGTPIDPVGLVRNCDKCGQEKPLTLEYFDGRGRSRTTKKRLFTATCKACLHPPTEFEKLKAQGMKRCPSCRRILPATEEFFLPNRVKEFVQTYCHECRPVALKAARGKNIAHYRMKSRLYAEQNPEARRATIRKFYASPKGKLLIARANRLRKARKKGAIGTYSETEWELKLTAYDS